MIQPLLKTSSGPIFYPESDGQPMAENTRQLRWIVRLYGNLEAIFAARPDVFVGANQFWYPDEGDPDMKLAPDVYVVFGRPKGDRGSYKQWEEAGVPMTVVFEVLSPGNDVIEMDDKQVFYEDHGVEEYYLFDPDKNALKVFVRQGDVFRRVRKVNGYISPRLQIRFDLSGPEMVVYGPDDRPFLTIEELEAARKAEEKRANEAEQRAHKAEQRMVRLVDLGRKARRGQASAEELAELERLEEQLPPLP